MAVSKSVAAPSDSVAKVSIPETAGDIGGELQTAPVTPAISEGTQVPSATAAVTRSRNDSLAKARAARAAKAASKTLAKKALEVAERIPSTPVSQIQSVLADEARADRHSFGDI